MEVMTPTNFRKDFFNNLKRIVKNNQPEEITISGDNNINDGVILVPKREWTRIQEEIYLEKTGTLDVVFDRMKNATDDDFEEAWWMSGKF